MWCTQGDEEQRAHAARVLCVVLEAVRVAAVGLLPVVPSLSAAILTQLGYSTQQVQVGGCGRMRCVTVWWRCAVMVALDDLYLETYPSVASSYS